MKPTMAQDSAAQQLVPARSDILDCPRRVADVMTRDAITLSPHQSFAEAVGLMANRPFHHVLVVDAEQRLRGVISDRDVLRALSRIPDWNKKSVSEIMTGKPVTATPDMPISVAIKLMLAMRINCLPVLGAEGRVCGILTSTDLLKAYEKVQLRLEG